MHEMFAFTLRKWAAFGVSRSPIFLERGGESGWERWVAMGDEEHIPAHNSLSLDAAALFCCCQLWMTKSACCFYFLFFYVLIWRMGEGLLTSWQQHKNSQKITANKFTTLTALPRPRSFTRVGLLTLQQPGSDVGRAAAACVPLLSAMSERELESEREHQYQMEWVKERGSATLTFCVAFSFRSLHSPFVLHFSFRFWFGAKTNDR